MNDFIMINEDFFSEGESQTEEDTVTSDITKVPMDTLLDLVVAKNEEATVEFNRRLDEMDGEK